MSYVSTQAKLNTASKKLGHKCRVVRKDYTNFAGTTVPPLTKKQYNKAMALSEKMKDMRLGREGEYQPLLKNSNL